MLGKKWLVYNVRKKEKVGLFNLAADFSLGCLIKVVRDSHFLRYDHASRIMPTKPMIPTPP